MCDLLTEISDLLTHCGTLQQNVRTSTGVVCNHFTQNALICSNMLQSFSPSRIRAAPDFCSGSSRKPAIFTNQAQIQLRSKCRQILVFGRICKIAYTKLQRSVFQLISKNCAVGVAIFSIHLLTLLRSHHHLVTNEISHYEYCMQILDIHRV